MKKLSILLCQSLKRKFLRKKREKSLSFLQWFVSFLSKIKNVLLAGCTVLLTGLPLGASAEKNRPLPWPHFLDSLQLAPEQQQLEAVNRTINRLVRFAEDQVIWRRKDYWATPHETFNKGYGDCEDYAIAKYFSLRYLGFSEDKLWMTYVKAHVGNTQDPLFRAHMVLAYYAHPSAAPLILDNLVTSIDSVSLRPDLRIVFQFNSHALVINKQRYSLSALPHWTRVIEKMRPLEKRFQASKGKA